VSIPSPLYPKFPVSDPDAIHVDLFSFFCVSQLLQFHREGTEPLRDDEITILNGVLSLNEKKASQIMTPIKVSRISLA
jgi:hypothetical protein